MNVYIFNIPNKRNEKYEKQYCPKDRDNCYVFS